MTKGAVIRSIGTHLPSNKLTNEQLCEKLGVDTEWVLRRTGIRQRFIVDEGESTSDLAIQAGRKALAGRPDLHVDTVLVATATPDRKIPGCAPRVASELMLSGVAAFDISAVCSGFVYGLAMARALIVSGQSEGVLLIGADTFSTVVDFGDSKVAPLFGDGAGAVVLSAGDSDEPGAVSELELGSDGAQCDLIMIPSGGSSLPTSDEPSDRYLKLEGRAVFQSAVRKMTEACRAVLYARGVSADSVDWLVGHQANIRILRSLAASLGIPDEKAVVDIHRVGNTSAASIPLALAALHDSGRAKPGDDVLLTAFGGGVTWGAAWMTWPQNFACNHG